MSSIGHKIRPKQFAFRAQHLTMLQMVKFTDQLCQNINNREKITTIFLDVEKEIDRVWHQGIYIFIYKLQRIGKLIQFLKIINCFLNDYSFSVKVENPISISRPAHAGVPQGSCLSPPLYLVYTNDIPQAPKASGILLEERYPTFHKGQELQKSDHTISTPNGPGS